MRDAAAPPSLPLADRYTIERELGRGGMATVWLAEERKHGRKVAIKVMRPEFAASLNADRFLREIGIAARLSHPHIVPLIDSGEVDGLPYYVSPFVPGGSLRDRLEREGRLAIKDALRIAQEVGAGLDYAHREGFVHRDVKPENILFADGHALLADFGVARATCSDHGTLVTEVGMALGTPEYMSPEQASGESDLGSRSDVYSFACVVYEMLAGRPPFRGTSSRAVMSSHLVEPPRSSAPSVRTSRRRSRRRSRARAPRTPRSASRASRSSSSSSGPRRRSTAASSARRRAASRCSPSSTRAPTPRTSI